IAADRMPPPDNASPTTPSDLSDDSYLTCRPCSRRVLIAAISASTISRCCWPQPGSPATDRSVCVFSAMAHLLPRQNSRNPYLPASRLTQDASIGSGHLFQFVDHARDHRQPAIPELRIPGVEAE